MSGAELIVTGEDCLRVNARGSVAGVTLAIEGRTISDDACLVPFADVHAPASDRSLTSTFTRLPAGALNGLQVRVASGTAKRAQVYVTVELVRGSGVTVQSLGILAAGYVSSGVPIAFPASGVSGPLDGPGFLRSVLNAQPAAGVDWSIVVPTGARWRPIALLATLTTAVAVANRVVSVVLDDGATAYAKFGANINQAASLAFLYTVAPSNGLGVMAGTLYLVPLPDWIVLLAGHRLLASTALLQAADQWSAQQLLVEEWIEP